VLIGRARRTVVAVIALAFIASTSSEPAVAGEYTVNVCRHADGSQAPTDGWQLSVADDFAANDTAANSCALGGLVELGLRAGTAHGRVTGAMYDSATIAFAATPPPGTGWTQASIWWAYQSNPSGPAGGADQIAGSIGGAPQATCAWGSAAASPCSSRGLFVGPPLSPANETKLSISPDQAAGPLTAAVTCSSAPSACPSVSGEAYGQLRLWRLRVTLLDTSPPALTTPSPLPPSITQPKVAVSISATDAGSGVHTAQLLVDGTPTGEPAVIDGAGGHCARQPDDSFDYLAPCPLSVSGATVTLDASSATNGAHGVAVRVADAAGNVTDSPATPVIVAEPPPPVPLSAIPSDNPLRGQGRVHNGSGGADGGTLTAGLRPLRGQSAVGRPVARRYVRSGHRVELGGRLVGSDGKPVAGALLAVTTTPQDDAPRSSTLRTGSDGRYARTLSWGRSRSIVVTWYPWGDSTRAAAERVVGLLGRARVSLRVQPRRPRNGSPLRLTGHLTGGRAGMRVIIQVRVGRFWRTSLLPRVDAHGRYVARRLLTRSADVSYCLRARVLSQPGLPYVAGSSPIVCRHVGRG
jgi:hypothetical protein